MNNKSLKSADDLAEFSILDMQNRDSNDYFFNKSDLEKMDHFMRLIERYKLCNNHIIILMKVLNYGLKKTPRIA